MHELVAKNASGWLRSVICRFQLLYLHDHTDEVYVLIIRVRSFGLVTTICASVGLEEGNERSFGFVRCCCRDRRQGDVDC